MVPSQNSQDRPKGPMRASLYIIDSVFAVPSQSIQDRPEGSLWGPHSLLKCQPMSGTSARACHKDINNTM